jgi:hypothetical protein
MVELSNLTVKLSNLIVKLGGVTIELRFYLLHLHACSISAGFLSQPL